MRTNMQHASREKKGKLKIMLDFQKNSKKDSSTKNRTQTGNKQE